MSKFRKQRYELVAKILRTQLDRRTPFYSKGEQAEEDHWAELYSDAAARIAVKDIAYDFHNVFRVDSDRYDPTRYFIACGIYDWEDITEPTEHDVQPYETPDFYGEQG